MSSLPATLSALADHRTRRVVSLVGSRDAPVAERDLATRLVAPDPDESRADVAREDRRSAHLQLVHATLPKLDEAGLVDWNREDGTVAAATHPAFDDPAIERLLDAGEGWDDALSALAHERRAIVLRVLATRDGPTTRRDLAAAVHDRETEQLCSEPGSVTAVRASLHHVHLPVLADAELVEYDAEEGRVAPTDHPVLEAAPGHATEPWPDTAPDATDGTDANPTVQHALGRVGRSFEPGN